MRLTLTIAGLYGASAMALKAFSRHGLSADPAQLQSLSIATDMQLLHGILLFAMGWLRPHFPNSSAYLSAALLAGVALFCFPIYLHVLLGAPRALLMVTPGGGILLIAGWTALAVLPWLPRKDNSET